MKKFVVDNGWATERDVMILEDVYIENNGDYRWKSFNRKEIATPNCEGALKLKRRVASAISAPNSNKEAVRAAREK